MKIIRYGERQTIAIEDYQSVGATSARLVEGHGQARVHLVRIEPGGEIGPHPTGYGQLWVIVEGEGWAAGADGVRAPIEVGAAAWFERDEVHSKGSTSGLSALLIQVGELRPCQP